MELTKKALREMKEGNNSDLEKAVITDILSQGSSEEIQTYIEDVLQYGCVSGMVTSLIYYKDTDKFFIKHHDEIFNLLEEMKQQLGGMPNFEMNSNNLAWFAYEEITRKIANEFEIDC